MLSASDTDIQKTSALILNRGYDVAFVVPTETGLQKSIIDAHQAMRAFLKRNDVHDFFLQGQGDKVITECIFLTNQKSKRYFIDVKVSLYRPKTKTGDPRITRPRMMQPTQTNTKPSSTTSTPSRARRIKETTRYHRQRTQAKTARRSSR